MMSKSSYTVVTTSVKRAIQKARTWVVPNKAVVSTVLVTLATLSAFFNATWQSDKSELQSKLLYDVSLVSVTHSAWAANNAEITLRRSMGEWCLAAQPTDTVTKGGCGSNNFLLSVAAHQRDALQGDDIRASDAASTTLARYNAQAPLYDALVGLSSFITILLLMATIIVTLL